MFKIKCPKCNIGELFLYKETECVYRIPLTKRNTLSKRKIHNTPLESDTSKDYLECENEQCCANFDYDLDDKGQLINISERYHGGY